MALVSANVDANRRCRYYLIKSIRVYILASLTFIRAAVILPDWQRDH
jgi:hypothetical protein